MKQLLFLSTFLFLSNFLFAQGWGEIQKIVPDDRAQSDEFGYAVAIQGEYAVASAHKKNVTSNLNGAVYVYLRDSGGNWNQVQRLIQSDVRQFDQFGDAISIDGNYMIIGCRNQDYDENNSNYLNDAPGAAYVYEKDTNGDWIEVQKLVASDRTILDVFGDAVAISGNYLVVSAPWEDEDENDMNTIDYAGSAFVFERDTNGIWQRVQKIVASDRAANDRFGDEAVAIDGNTIAIGAFRESEDASGGNTLGNAGAVYIYERDGAGDWHEIQKVVASDREPGDWFGKSVALKGDLLIIGAEREDNLSGAGYVFERDTNGNWNEIQKLTAEIRNPEDRFGNAISMDSNHAIIGAYDQSVPFGHAGTAYVFEKGTNGVWTQVQQLIASDRGAGDSFGFGVAIDQGFAIVGAFEEDEDPTGANSMISAGAAYIFDANEPTLSIIGNELNDSIVAYPNPTNGLLNIDFGTQYNVINISIFNTLGQQVFSEKYSDTKKIQFEINQPNGMYLVEIRTDEEIISVLKISKH